MMTSAGRFLVAIAALAWPCISSWAIGVSVDERGDGRVSAQFVHAAAAAGPVVHQHSHRPLAPGSDPGPDQLPSAGRPDRLALAAGLI